MRCVRAAEAEAAVIAQVDERLAVLEREAAPEGGWSDQERYAQKLALWAEFERE